MFLYYLQIASYMRPSAECLGVSYVKEATSEELFSLNYLFYSI